MGLVTPSARATRRRPSANANSHRRVRSRGRTPGSYQNSRNREIPKPSVPGLSFNRASCICSRFEFGRPGAGRRPGRHCKPSPCPIISPEAPAALLYRKSVQHQLASSSWASRGGNAAQRSASQADRGRARSRQAVENSSFPVMARSPPARARAGRMPAPGAARRGTNRRGRAVILAGGCRACLHTSAGGGCVGPAERGNSVVYP